MIEEGSIRDQTPTQTPESTTADTKEQTSSEEICSVVAGPAESAVFRRNSACFEDLLIFSLRIFEILTKVHTKIDDNMDYGLRQIALALYPTNVPTSSMNFSEINSILIKFYKKIHSKNLSKPTKQAFLKLLTHLSQFAPETKNLAEIFRVSYEDSESLVGI